MSRSTAASDTAPSPRRSPRVAARARAVRAAQPPHADGTGLVVAPREGSPRRAFLLLLWLGWVHVNWCGREAASELRTLVIARLTAY